MPDLPLRPPFLVEHRVLPLAADDARLTVALADPLDACARQAVALATSKAPAVQLVHRLLARAVDARASDLHLALICALVRVSQAGRTCPVTDRLRVATFALGMLG